MHIIRLVCTAVLICTLAGPAHAQRRVTPQPTAAPSSASGRHALVIGNANYPVGPLLNPGNDADDMAAALRACGFSVTLLKDAGHQTMEDAVSAFAAKIRATDIALVYFSGHGLQFQGDNYLVPVNAVLRSDTDIRYKTVSMSWVLDTVGAVRNAMKIFIFDACRDNPFARSFRTIGRGLAQVTAPAGTYIAYATGPGAVASDNPSGRNGLYTGRLLRKLRTPGLKIEELFKTVRAEVQTVSGGGQVPWESSSIVGDFYFFPTDEPSPSTPPSGGASEPAPTSPVSASPLPPSSGVRLDDLKAAADREAAAIAERAREEARIKMQWDNRLQQMETDFKQVSDFAKGNTTSDLKRQAWRQFANAFSENNPYSSRDEELLQHARNEMAYWETYFVNSIGMPFVLIPAGSFYMGAPESEKDSDDDERPVHTVRISRGFYMGIYEVTQAQWEAVMGSNPSRFKGSNLPVEQVSYEDCQEFIRRLNAREGGAYYRLPTEAEWEYACRAGSTGAYAGSLDAMGWYDSNSGSQTHPVGHKKPNSWGLYDMHGNVWEWCSDWEGSYPSETVTDPVGASSGSARVFRGGSWSRDASGCRSADRIYSSPGLRLYILGFRLMRTSQ